MTYRPLRGALLLAAAMLSVSFMGVFSRRLDCNGIAVQFLRAFFAVLVFLLIEALRHRRPPALPSRRELPVVTIYAVCILWSSFFFLMAFRYTTFANTIILHYLTPFLVLLGESVVYRQRLRRIHLLVAACGLGGIVLGVYQTVSLEPTMGNLLGNGAALVSAVGFSGIILMTRHTRRLGLPINQTLFYSWLLVLLLVVPPFIIWGRLPLTLPNLGYGFLLGSLCTVVVYVLMNLGMQYVSAGQAAIINFSEVVFTIIAGAVFFGERITGPVVAGCAVLLACIAVISLDKKNPLTTVP